VADDLVLVEVADRVAVLTLHRPEARNALTGELPRAYIERPVLPHSTAATTPPDPT